MKKTLWMLGVAVAALTSCTESEVLDVPESRVIGFESHVDNQTRVVSDLGSGTMVKFWVFGFKMETGDSEFGEHGTEAEVFCNVPVKRDQAVSTSPWGYENVEHTKYWSKNHTYRFAAYANGTESLTAPTVVSYDPDEDIITFTNYVAGDKDLVATISGDREIGASIDGDDIAAVPFTFKHMLSKVQFSFTSTANVTIEITNLRIDAINKGTGTYEYNTTNPTEPIINWTPSTDGNDKGYTSTLELIPTTTVPAIENFCVIPQMNKTDETTHLSVTFTLTTYDGDGHFINSDNKTVSLASNVHDGEWKPGYVYNYHAVFGDDFDEAPITFTVYQYPSWTAGSEGGTTINP